MNRKSHALCAMLIAVILITAGCKKTNPSVVGNWKFASFTASIRSYATYNHDSVSETINYNDMNKTMVFIIQHTSPSVHADTAVVSYLYSNLNILGNGSYAVTENEDSAGSTHTGNWEYMSSNSSNNAIDFINGGSYVLSQMGSNILDIQSISSNQMVLTYNNSSLDSNSSYSYRTATVTYTR